MGSLLLVISVIADPLLSPDFARYGEIAGMGTITGRWRPTYWKTGPIIFFGWDDIRLKTVFILGYF